MAILARVAEGLAVRAGFRWNPEQPGPLWSALARRAALVKERDRQAYLVRLLRDEPEWLRLAEEVVIHETAFFRHTGQFKGLREFVLPELARLRVASRELRLWSAACATGEEPYSLAIALLDLGLPADWRLQVLATDISVRALKTAERGIFPASRLKLLPEGMREKWFTAEGNEWKVKPEVRDLVTFTQLNLVEPKPLPALLCEMDVVFLENVLIYFERDATERVVGKMRGSLRENGYLFLGYSETLYGISAGFVPVLLGDTYVYRRSDKPEPQEDRHSRTRLPVASAAAVAPASPPAAARPRPPLSPSASPAAPPPAALPSAPPPAATAPAPPASAVQALAAIEARAARGDLAGAARAAERRLAAEPGAVAVKLLLARIHAAQGSTREAADLARQLLAVDPLHVPSYLLLAELCFRQGELTEAAAQLDRAVYLDAANPLAHFQLGNIHQKQGNRRQAVHAYRNALRVIDRFAPAWDSGFTRDLLARVCEQNVARLSSASGPPPPPARQTRRS